MKVLATFSKVLATLEVIKNDLQILKKKKGLVNGEVEFLTLLNIGDLARLNHTCRDFEKRKEQVNGLISD